MTETAHTRQLDLDRVMEEANRRYAELVGSPLHRIESRQTKALAAAIVAETNRALAEIEAFYRVQFDFLASVAKDLDAAVEKVAAANIIRLGAPGE